MKTQDHVRRLLKESGLPDHVIAAGIGRSKQWVWLFKTEKMRSPSVDAMDDLHRLLTGRNLMEQQNNG